MEKIKPKDAAKLQKKARQLFIAGVIILVTGGMLVFVLTSVANQQAKKYVSLKQNAIALQQSKEDSEDLHGLANREQEGLQLIDDAFPDETTILGVIQYLETIVQQYDEAGLVRFSGNTPVKTNNELSISLNMKFAATPSDMLEFVRQLERVPYIIEIVSLEMKSPQGISNPGQAVIGVRLYVQDPFSPEAN